MSLRHEISTSIDDNLGGGGATIAVDSLGNALIEIMHCSTREFRVGVSLMIQSMFKANPNSPSIQAVSVRLPLLSVGVD